MSSQSAVEIRSIRSSSRATRFVWITCGACLALEALHFLFLFSFPGLTGFPSVLKRTWGFHFISYFSLPVRIEFYLLAAACSLPASNRVLFHIVVQACSDGLKKFVARRKRILFFAAAAAAIPLCWALRCKYGFLGDNYIRVDNIVRNDFLRDEIATIPLLHVFYRAAHKILALDGASSLKLFTYLCGGAFVYLALRIADSLGRNRFEKIVTFLFYVSFGTMYHFFGYLEIYSLPVVLAGVYVFSSIQSMRNKMPVALPGTILALSCAFNLVSLMYAPSFLVVLYYTVLKKHPVFRKPLTWFIVIGLAAIPAVFGGGRFFFPMMYPLVSHPDGATTMFSLSHVWEYINGLLLSCGPALFITPVCLVYAAARRIRLTPHITFLLAASACMLAGLFVFNEILGSGDWDIYSFASIFVNVLAITLFFHCFGEQGLEPFAQYASVAFVGLMMLHAGPWFIINAGEKSVRRYEDCIMSDPASYYREHPAPMKIAMALEKDGLSDRAFSFYKKALDMDSTDQRNKYNYAVMLVRHKNRPDLALKILTELCDQNPFYTAPLELVLEIAQNTGDDTLKTRALMRVYQVFSRNRAALTPYFSQQMIADDMRELTRLLVNGKNDDLAEKVCNALIDLDPQGAESRYLLAAVYYGQAKYDKTIGICRILNKFVPQKSEPYILASFAFEARKQLDSATAVVQECLAAARDDKAQFDAHMELQRIARLHLGK